MRYTPLNNFLLIEKKETTGLTISGQDDDPNAVMHGIVVGEAPDIDHCLFGYEVVFVRGQSRKLKLDGKEYFIIKEDKVMLYVKNDS